MSQTTTTPPNTSPYIFTTNHGASPATITLLNIGNHLSNNCLSSLTPPSLNLNSQQNHHLNVNPNNNQYNETYDNNHQNHHFNSNIVQ